MVGLISQWQNHCKLGLDPREPFSEITCNFALLSLFGRHFTRQKQYFTSWDFRPSLHIYNSKIIWGRELRRFNPCEVSAKFYRYNDLLIELQHERTTLLDYLTYHGIKKKLSIKMSSIRYGILIFPEVWLDLITDRLVTLSVSGADMH